MCMKEKNLIFDNEKTGFKSDYFLEASFPVPKFRRLFLTMSLMPRTYLLKGFVTGMSYPALLFFPRKSSFIYSEANVYKTKSS